MREYNAQINENDYELLYMIHQKDEMAEKYLLEKYDVYFSYLLKENWILSIPGYEIDDIKNMIRLKVIEATDLYNEYKECSFMTFANLCVRRKLQSLYRSFPTHKLPISRPFSLDFKVMDQEEMEYISLVQNNQLLYDPDFYTEYRRLEKEMAIFIEQLSSQEKKIWNCMMDDVGYNEGATLLNMTKKQYSNSVYRLKKRFIQHLYEKAV